MSDHDEHGSQHHGHDHGHDHGNAHDDHAHDWFRHAVGEVAQDDHGSFNATMVLAVIFATMLIVAGVIITLAPYTKRTFEGMAVQRQERNEAAYLEFRNARAAWDSALHGEPVWINRAEGRLQIPYSLAADQVIRAYAQRGR